MLGDVEFCGDESLGICEKHPAAATTKNTPTRRNSLIMDFRRLYGALNNTPSKPVILPTEAFVCRGLARGVALTFTMGLDVPGEHAKAFGICEICRSPTQAHQNSARSNSPQSLWRRNTVQR